MRLWLPAGVVGVVVDVVASVVVATAPAWCRWWWRCTQPPRGTRDSREAPVGAPQSQQQYPNQQQQQQATTISFQMPMRRRLLASINGHCWLTADRRRSGGEEAGIDWSVIDQWLINDWSEIRMRLGSLNRKWATRQNRRENGKQIQSNG